MFAGFLRFDPVTDLLTDRNEVQKCCWNCGNTLTIEVVFQEITAFDPLLINKSNHPHGPCGWGFHFTISIFKDRSFHIGRKGSAGHWREKCATDVSYISVFCPIFPVFGGQHPHVPSQGSFILAEETCVKHVFVPFKRRNSACQQYSAVPAHQHAALCCAQKNEDLQVTFDDGSSFDIFPGEEILKGRDFLCF